jgi:hypothetical protein
VGGADFRVIFRNVGYRTEGPFPAGHSGAAKERSMKVRNLNRTTQGACPSGTWFAHWEIYSGQNAFMCFVKGCIRRPTVGGRVQKDKIGRAHV